MIYLLGGFLYGLAVSSFYEKPLKRFLEFEQTRKEIRSL